MGKVEKIDFPGFEALLDRFEREVYGMWKEEDEEH
jgi:hypothetical protein